MKGVSVFLLGVLTVSSLVALWLVWGEQASEKKNAGRLEFLEKDLDLRFKASADLISSLRDSVKALEDEVSALKNTDAMLLSRTKTYEDLAHKANVALATHSGVTKASPPQKILLEFSPVPLTYKSANVPPPLPQERKKLLKKVKGQLKELSK